VRAELDAAVEVGEQLAALAQRGPDTMPQLVAHWALGQTSLFRGAMAAARIHLQQGIALYDPAAHYGISVHAGFPGDLGVFCRCFDAHALWHLGFPDQAAQRMDEALALSKQLGHPFTHALALAYASMLYQFRRETSRARAAAEAAIAICQDEGFAYYLAWVTILRGWAFTAEVPAAADGIAQMHSGLTAIQATGAKLRQPYYLALLADACARRGETELGLALLTEALAEIDSRHECWHEPELHRLRSELLACGTRADEAEACLHRALAIARAQGSRALELRAAVGLARRWHGQGKRAASAQLLAPIYAWFTEGFGTADLLEARALLDELS